MVVVDVPGVGVAGPAVPAVPADSAVPADPDATGGGGCLVEV